MKTASESKIEIFADDNATSNRATSPAQLSEKKAREFGLVAPSRQGKNLSLIHI